MTKKISQKYQNLADIQPPSTSQTNKNYTLQGDCDPTDHNQLCNGDGNFVPNSWANQSSGSVFAERKHKAGPVTVYKGTDAADYLQYLKRPNHSR